jgi:hypothetical protein
MAEADAEHTTRAPSEKISVSEAFHLLLAAQLQPHVARHRLNEAVLTNEVRLWVNDSEGAMVVVNPNFIATHLRVAAQTEPDGRWIAYIAPTKALVPMKYIWEVDRAEIENLLGKTAEPKPKLVIGDIATPSAPGRRRGRLKAETWAGDIAKKLKCPIPEDDSALAELIVAQMTIEAVADRTLGDPKDTDYIRTRLPEWRKLW